MGLAKYFEDDCRIYTDRLYSNGLFEIGQIKQFIAEHKCPYCQCAFANKENMFAHIRKAHNISEPILFINGLVVKGKDTVYVSEIKSASIQMYGYCMQVSVNDVVISAQSDDDGIELTNIVSELVSNNKECKIRFGNRCSKIERYSLYSINQNRLDAYVSEWENNLKTGKTFKPFYTDPREVNEAECFYLKGIYNYYVACQAKDKDKTDRYYEANSILKQFIPTNSLGLCIQKIIAFKLNWVNKLDDLCSKYGTNDDFCAVINFYRNEKRIVDPTDDSVSNYIFIEDDLQEALKAIVAYNDGNYEVVNRYLDTHAIDTITDSNLADKVLLLRYRMCMLNGNKEEAEYAFNEIQTDGFSR